MDPDRIREDRARRLVLEATDARRDHAEALLALDAGLGREGFDVALVLGEAERVRAALARDPGAATRPAGAREWLPLLYVTHSAFLGGERTDGLLACARALLDAGADPDSSWQHPEFGALGALYGAAGVAHEPRMTALLLAAGAEPRRRRVRLPRHRDLRSHVPAPAARRRRTRGRHERAGARARHRGPREGAAAARARRRERGGALAAVGDLPWPLARGHPPARRARRRRARLGRAERAHALRPGLAHGPAGPLRAAGRARRAARGGTGRRADRALLRGRPRRRASGSRARIRSGRSESAASSSRRSIRPPRRGAPTPWRSCSTSAS